MKHDLADGLVWYLVFLFSTCFHEAAHAWTAHRLGDDTAYRGGQVTLDPTPHIRREPFGMVLVPLLSYFFGGWMIGWASAPYDPQWAWRYPKRSGLMALAGPVANLILVLVAAILMRLAFEWGVMRQPDYGSMTELVVATGDANGLWALAAKVLSLFFSLNLLLAAFNLLPFPPLDGGSVPLIFLPAGAAEKYWVLLRQPVWSFMGLIVAWRLFGEVFPPLFGMASKVLYLALTGH